MKLLHISFDISDELVANKTVAIKNIIDTSNKLGHENFYISLNRGNFKNIKDECIIKSDHITIRKFGMPWGIFMVSMLKSIYRTIEDTYTDIEKIDLIHAHKLSYEGYIAYLINKKYNKPYMISVRTADFRVMKVRRDLLNKYKEILMKSSKIFFISPWMIDELKQIMGDEFFRIIEDRIEILPNIIKNKAYQIEKTNNNRYVTIFKITKKNLKRKNIYRLLDAIKIIIKSGINIKLDIIGGGSGLKYLKKYIEKEGLQDNIQLLGEIDNKQLLDKISTYKSFILCSFPETFGLVYIEALIKGLPIIYTKNAGIYGYFKKYDIGKAVMYNDINEIVESILDMERNYENYRKEIKRLHRENYLRIFTEEDVASRYNYAITNK